eukprot:2677618-Prymnesium_polylepis.1
MPLADAGGGPSGSARTARRSPHPHPLSGQHLHQGRAACSRAAATVATGSDLQGDRSHKRMGSVAAVPMAWEAAALARARTAASVIQVPGGRTDAKEAAREEAAETEAEAEAAVMTESLAAAARDAAVVRRAVVTSARAVVEMVNVWVAVARESLAEAWALVAVRKATAVYAATEAAVQAPEAEAKAMPAETVVVGAAAAPAREAPQVGAAIADLEARLGEVAASAAAVSQETVASTVVDSTVVEVEVEE